MKGRGWKIEVYDFFEMVAVPATADTPDYDIYPSEAAARRAIISALRGTKAAVARAIRLQLAAQKRKPKP